MNREEYKDYVIYKVIPSKIESYLKSRSTINRHALLKSITSEVEELDDYLMKDAYYNTKKNVKYKVVKPKYDKVDN